MSASTAARPRDYLTKPFDPDEHTDALFSHGICPACLVKVMEELDPPDAGAGAALDR